MSDLSILKETIGQLPPDEFAELYDYIHRHARSLTTWGIVPAENVRKLREAMRPVQEEASRMTDEEIDRAIDQAVQGVRRGRKATSRD